MERGHAFHLFLREIQSGGDMPYIFQFHRFKKMKGCKSMGHAARKKFVLLRKEDYLNFDR